MKICIYIFVIALVGIVVAQGEGKGPTVTDVLTRRGMILQDSAKRTLSQLKQQGRDHLVAGLEHELVLIEALILDLHKNPVFSDHHKNAIEEQLLHLENRVAEELAVIEMAANHQHHGLSVEKLINYAEGLLNLAHNTLRHVPQTDVDVSSALNEVKLIGQLINKLRASPDAKDLTKEEEEMVRHEQTLEQLLARMAKHVKPDSGSHHSGTVNPHGV